MAEILAPVGGKEQLIAAVRCGADAVYLGAKGFNARRNAQNFTDEEFDDAVRYCHIHGVKVYATINTLVFDSELADLENVSRRIANAGVDGVIIQDLAVLELFKNRYPSIERIASTQLAIHNVSGALLAQKLGFDTVVLARELSLDEIKTIVENIQIKSEVFVHGAHCMSVSGMCYVSSMLGGRSGNRGLCAQPCRLDWQSGSKEYALSLKDMSLLPYLNTLANIGVDSFKIEGRMKRAEYVAAAVTACKNALSEGRYDEAVLRSVFSRSGFTNGYLLGKRNADMFGYRTKEDVVSASDTVLKQLSSLYAKEKQSVPITMKISIDGRKANLTITDQDNNRVSVSGRGSESAVNRSVTAEDVRRSLSKLGDTPYDPKRIDVSIQENQFISAAALNKLRREATEQLSSLRALHVVHEKPFDFSIKAQVQRTSKEIPQRWARISSKAQVDGVTKFDRVIVPLHLIDDAIISTLGKDRLLIELPTVQFPDSGERLIKQITVLKERGLNSIYTNNIYGLELADRLGFQVTGGFGLNAVNTHSLSAFAALGMKGITLSFELTAERIKNLGHPLSTGIVVYGRVPLMQFRNCPVRATIGCNMCREKGKITDRFGISFPVECNQKSTSALLNSVPICLSDQAIPAVDHHLFWFTDEGIARIDEVNRLFLQGMKPDFKRTTGLYYREVL